MQTCAEDERGLGPAISCLGENNALNIHNKLTSRSGISLRVTLFKWHSESYSIICPPKHPQNGWYGLSAIQHAVLHDQKSSKGDEARHQASSHTHNRGPICLNRYRWTCRHSHIVSGNNTDDASTRWDPRLGHGRSGSRWYRWGVISPTGIRMSQARSCWSGHLRSKSKPCLKHCYPFPVQVQVREQETELEWGGR